MVLSFNLLEGFSMSWFGKKETSDDAVEPTAKKISLNFRGLSAAAVRDIGRSTIGAPAVMPDLRGLAANDNLSSAFNAAAAFTGAAFQPRRPPKGPAP